MSWLRRIALVLVIVSAPASGVAADAPPSVEGPDVPPVTEPIDVVTAFDGERYECSEGPRAAVVAVPEGPWNRVILTVTTTPDGDPWDRVFGVAIEGVEVIRGTTPRAPATIHKDVTEFASLLPPGDEATVSLYLASWVGALRATVSLAFYADEPTAALVRPPRARAIPVATWGRLHGHETTIEAAPTFGSTPTGATVELTISGHAGEEFWFTTQLNPRTFRISVDGVEVATARAMPYVYALLGFGNENANTACVGPGTSSFGDTVHPVMWWTAQQGLDRAGIHTGNGEIPPYRVDIAPEHLALLSGERTVTVEQSGGGAVWITSLAFLLD